MSEIRTVTTLRSKRAEILASISLYEKRLAQARADLAHVTACITIFEASGDGEDVSSYVEGSRPYLGALLLGYYTDDGRLTYAGRVGTGMPAKVLADLRRRLEPLARKTSPLSAAPPRKTRFGSPLVLSQVHWVEPQLVAEITYLTSTGDGLLRQTVYVGLRSDKPADQVRREVVRARSQRSRTSMQIL